MYDLLNLKGAVGRGQENSEDDVFATDNALREIGAYAPQPEYAGEPQRYITEPVVNAIESVQEQNRIKIDGYAEPDGPTERAINNTLLRKPRGAGLLHDFDMSIGDTVGNGFKNAPRDVGTVKRALGGLGYLPEDPFDRPSGFIEESTTAAIKRFQGDNDLTIDGWLQPGGETEAALNSATNRLAQANRTQWAEYFRRAPEAFGGANRGEVASAVAGWLEPLTNGGRGAESAPDTRPRSSKTLPDNRLPQQSQAEIGDVSSDPEANFGSWAIKRSDVLPEGVVPPDDPLKPNTLPRDMSGEMPRYDVEGRAAPIDVGIDRKREVRWLISRLYRVGAEDSKGQPRLTDEEFDSYLAVAKEHIKPEHYPVFELTARSVRAGALDWHTAATRLAAYFAPETSGEAFVDFVLDLVPIVGQAKAAKELHGHLEDAADAANFGDARAHDEALTKAALAMVALILPGAGAGAAKVAARLLKKELHHLIPYYLGGLKDGPLLPLARSEHRGAAISLHSKMQQFFKSYDPGLVHSWKNPGWLITRRYLATDRRDALDAFYRSLQKSAIRYEREAFDAWQKIFPEALKYLKP
jgi:hypothetical protein